MQVFIWTLAAATLAADTARVLGAGTAPGGLQSPRLYPAYGLHYGIGTQLASMARGTSNWPLIMRFTEGTARGPKLGSQNKPQKQPHFEPRRGAKGEMRQH